MPLNLDELEPGFKYIKIGRLTKDIINLLGLNHDESDIIMWEDKFEYIHKHINDLRSKPSEVGTGNRHTLMVFKEMQECQPAYGLLLKKTS